MDSHNYQFSGRKSYSATHSIDATTRYCCTGAHSILQISHFLHCFPHPAYTSPNHTFFKSAMTLAAPPISAVSKPQYNFWTNITSYVLSHFLTPSLPCATRKPWSCCSEGMLHFKVIARANYLPKWSPGKAFGCSEVHSRNNTFFKWMIQEVFASYEKERKSDLFFSSHSLK